MAIPVIKLAAAAALGAGLAALGITNASSIFKKKPLRVLVTGAAGAARRGAFCSMQAIMYSASGAKPFLQHVGMLYGTACFSMWLC